MTYRAGVIGVGGVGRSHGDAYRDVEGVDVVSIADVVEEPLNAAGDDWDIPRERRYADHRSMLRREDLDAVSVASPTHLHRAHTVDAVEIGDPAAIWCEKPIAGSVADAEAMVEACDDAGAHLVINHSRRWADPYIALRDAIAGDELLGDLQTVNAQFKLELLRNGTHFVDMLYWLLDERAARVSGHLTGETPMNDRDLPIPVDDGGGGGHVVFEHGVFATFDCVVPRATSSGWFVFTGSDGRLSLNETDEETRHWRIADGEHVESSAGFFDGWTDWSTAFENAVRNIVALLDRTGENRSPGTEAVHVLEILIGLFVSHYTGSDVTLPLDRPLRDTTIRSW